MKLKEQWILRLPTLQIQSSLTGRECNSDEPLMSTRTRFHAVRIKRSSMNVSYAWVGFVHWHLWRQVHRKQRFCYHLSTYLSYFYPLSRHIIHITCKQERLRL